MSARQAGIELYRIISLLNAHQYHVVRFWGFFNAPQGTWEWEYSLLLAVFLGFTMTGLFQIGTLFGLRSPFRAKGLTFFLLTLTFYGRAVSALLAQFGFADRTMELRNRYPVYGDFSWYFTSYTIVTALTPILNPGMVSLSKSAYRFLVIGIIASIIWFQPPGYNLHWNGKNWVNPLCLYVFAGYFVLHGWIASGRWTWIPFFACFAAFRYLISHDIFGMVPPRWHWAVVTFRLIVVSTSYGYEWVAKPSMEYVSPLSYLWGTAAIFAFQTLSLPTGISKVITFIGPKIYMLHWLDQFCAGYKGELHSPLRVGERRSTPFLTFVNGTLISFQLIILVTLLEIYRDRLFQFLFNTAASSYSRLTRVRLPQGTFPRQWSRISFRRADSSVQKNSGSMYL
jgi:hypothetical protein